MRIKTKIKKFCLKISNFLKSRIYNKKHKNVIVDYTNNIDYLEWIKNNEPNLKELEEQKKYKFDNEPKISIVVPMYQTPEKFFIEMINSLKSQTYFNWELCLADGSPQKANYIDDVICSDNRIKYKKLEKNGGISYNTNCALEMSTGEYIALLDHDDLLLPFSLFEVVNAINKDIDAEFFYTDEDKFYESLDNRYDPSFKPEFSEDTLRSYNYITHLSIFKRSLMDKLKGFRSEYDGSQDYDIILRATEFANKIIHIPKVLYCWRVHQNSTAMLAEAKPYAYEAAISAISSHLERKGINAKVKHDFSLGFYKIDYEINDTPKISIIISNILKYKDICLCLDYLLNSSYKNFEILLVNDGINKINFDKILNIYDKVIDIKVIYISKNDYENNQNYATLNNFAVKETLGEYIVFMDARIRIITSNWIEELLGICQRENVGAVGAKILYMNNTIEHAGYVLGMNGSVGNVNRYLPDCLPGYYSRAVVVNNYSAVSSKCMMVKKSKFNDVNGFDKEYIKLFYDVDLCLKLLEKRLVNVYNPHVKVHYDIIFRNDKKDVLSRFKEKDDVRLNDKWPNFIKNDRYFNPNLRLDIENYMVNKNKIEKNNRW